MDLTAMMPFAKLLGIEVVSVAPHEVRARLPVTEGLCTTGKIVHGGALMAFADTLGAIGAFQNLPDGAKGTTTIESKTNFIGPGPEGSVLLGVATPVHVGRRTSVWQTHITRTEDERLVAVVTQSQMVL